MRKIILIMGLVIILFSSSAYSLDEENLSMQEKATSCLAESMKIFQELESENFTTNRVNDSLKEATSLFEAQLALEEKKKKHDFSMVIPYCERIKSIRENAFSARDELIALKKFYDESLTKDMNTSSANKIIAEIEGEITSERYERVSSLVSKAYEEIINIQSSSTTMNLFYTATTRSIKGFIIENWIWLSSTLIALFILFLIYKKSIRIAIIKRKIVRSEMRKKTLKSMIMKTQKDYFEKGNIPEGIYNIKVKKFAEMIRDIDREIPLLNEELIKKGYKNKEDKKDVKIKKR